MSVHLLLSQQSLRLSSIVFILFSLFFFSVYFHHSIFQLTYLFCLSYYAIVFFQSIFNFSNCVVHHCIFFISFRSFLNMFQWLELNNSYIFSTLVSRFWIIHTIITLNSSGSLFPLHLFGLVDFFLLPSSAQYVCLHFI